MTTTSGAPATAAPPAQAAVPREVWQISAVVVVGAFMAQLDGALVNIGLATIAGNLNSSLQTAQWIVSGYLLALVVGLPLCGWASRRVGPTRLWLWSVAAFTVTSVLCAVAGNIQLLIVFRVLQGIAGGLLLPVGQTVIAQAAGREAMGRVMSVVGAALVLAPALGPIAGGLLIAHASWPWLFLINIPVGLLALWLGFRILPRSTPQPVSGFDVTGFALVGLGLPAVTYAISSYGDNKDFGAPSFYGPLVAGAVVLVGFVLYSRRRSEPLLNLGLFAGRVFTAASVASFFAGAIQYGALVVWALYFQMVRGYGVVDSGLAMVGFALGAGLLPISGRLVDRFGGGPVALVGAVLTVVAAVPAALLPGGASLAEVEVFLFLLGVANALSVIPSSTAAYVSVRPPQVPDAVTLINIFLRLGGAVGASLCIAVLGGLTGDKAALVSAFHAAFWCVAGFGAVFTVFALALVLVGRSTTAGRNGSGPVRGSVAPAPGQPDTRR